MNDIQVAKNFKLKEFQCKDGSELVKLDENLLDKLQQLRDIVGPVQIVSAYRTPEYNKKVGGAPRSQHMEGKAADIKAKGMTPLLVAMAAEKVGFTGIGMYTCDGNSFTHVDVRPVKSYWKDAPGHKLISIKSLKEA